MLTEAHVAQTPWIPALLAQCHTPQQWPERDTGCHNTDMPACSMHCTLIKEEHFSINPLGRRQHLDGVFSVEWLSLQSLCCAAWLHSSKVSLAEALPAPAVIHRPAVGPYFTLVKTWRWNSHTIQFTCWRDRIQWFLVCSQNSPTAATSQNVSFPWGRSAALEYLPVRSSPRALAASGPLCVWIGLASSVEVWEEVLSVTDSLAWRALKVSSYLGVPCIVGFFNRPLNSGPWGNPLGFCSFHRRAWNQGTPNLWQTGCWP